MISAASRENGFAIFIPLKQTTSTSAKNAWASWVEIINFDQDDHGCLLIDVKCKSLVHLHLPSITLVNDGYKEAQVKMLPHWIESHDKYSQANKENASIEKTSYTKGSLENKFQDASEEDRASFNKEDLSKCLQVVFDDSEHLLAWYGETQRHSIEWIVARWLELLPVELNVKYDFAQQHSFISAKKFVETIIFNETEN